MWVHYCLCSLQSLSCFNFEPVVSGICMFSCVCAFMHVCVHMFVFVCTFLCVCVCVRAHMCVFVCMHVCVDMCVCMYMCVYVYIHVCVCSDESQGHQGAGPGGAAADRGWGQGVLRTLAGRGQSQRWLYLPQWNLTGSILYSHRVAWRNGWLLVWDQLINHWRWQMKNYTVAWTVGRQGGEVAGY